MKHTPGPWKVQGRTHIINVGAIPAETNYICLDIGPRWPYVSATTEQKKKTHIELCAEAEANAKLIAAAPELLEALETLTSIVGLTAIKYENQKEVLQEAYNIAIAAIKTAKGDK